MNLIDKYFEGKIIYLESLIPESNSISFNICNADPFKRIGELSFFEIKEYVNTQYDEEEDNYLENIIDIIDEEQKVLFVTDLREITFSYKTIEFRKCN